MGRSSAGLINFPTLALWKQTLDVPGLDIPLPAPSVLYLEIRSFHGMRIHDLKICVYYKERVQFL